MDKKIRQELFNQAKKWVYEAGKNIREKINEPLTIDTKANENDLVTETDKNTEKFFADNIKMTYPSHLLLGEEGYGDNITSLDGTVWIIDPIDGTMNFVHLKKDFAISLAIYHDGMGEIGLVYDVMADVLYSAIRGEGAYKNNERLSNLNSDVTLSKSILSFNHDLLCKSDQLNRDVIEDLVNAVRGTRIVGAAALDIALVAEGRLDIYISSSLSPWDVAAGLVILNEVEGVTTRHNGKTLKMLEAGTIISCNKVLHKDVVNNYLFNWTKGNLLY